MDIGTGIAILGGVIGLGGTVIGVGRWAGKRESADENISVEGKAAREETRVAVKRIDENVATLQANTAHQLKELRDEIRPLVSWHATREGTERELEELRTDSRENRERLIRIDARLETIERVRPARTRSRKTGGGS